MGGPRTVSPLQYDAVMTPLVSVEVNYEAKTYDEVLAEVDSGNDWAGFKVNRVTPGKAVRKSRLSETDESADVIIRQRRRADDVKDPMAYEMKPLDVDDVTKAMTSWKLEDKDSAGTFESNEQLKDPIKWFGVLVPQTLRQSQKHFVTGINNYYINIVVHSDIVSMYTLMQYESWPIVVLYSQHTHFLSTCSH